MVRKGFRKDARNHVQNGSLLARKCIYGFRKLDIILHIYGAAAPRATSNNLFTCAMTLKPVLIKTSISYVLLLFLVAPLFGQKKFSIAKSEMSFTSNAELELITAASNKVQGLIDPGTNQFAFTVDVKSFQGFNSALQREHFNEKYMESDKFPRARFSGKIIEPVDLSTDGSYEVRAKGELDIHGQKQTRIIKSRLTVSNGTINIDSRFFVPLSDHNISIPTIVSQKIATEIEVEFKATLSLQSL
jgi:polyisoprenoid-binding protein YceI